MLFKNVDKEYWDSLLKASLIGIHMVATTFIGLAIGYFLDKYLHTDPWLTMIFLFLGIAAGFKNMFQEVKKIQKSEERRNQTKNK
ncbi:MAG TPA: AtpZ/AtpI family protein [Desulfohalobiaceae bacterium]|nr:AtpZ/AtpI family protein [Desulfohalobiaceae bacterium]